MEEPSFIEALTERLGSRETAEAASRAFVEVVVEEVGRGGRVALTGFGVFDAGPDRRSGLHASQLRFRAGSAFRAMVNEGPGSLPSPVRFHPSEMDRQGHDSGESPEVSATSPAPSGARARTRAMAKPRGVLAFRHYELPPGVSMSAVLPASSPRCGIYVLHFDDGHRYVGQARDVLTRFGSHRRRWGDQITSFDFAPAAPGELNDLERRTIQRLEHDGTRLRNSALAGLPMGESPLDFVVDRVEQEQWLEGGTDTEYDFEGRIATAHERPRSGTNFAALRARGDYQDLRFALLLYLMSVVPWPHQTERRFWSMTAMPSTNRSRTQRRLTAISVNNVEVLVLVVVLEGDEWVMGGFVNVSPDMVREADIGWPVGRNQYRTVGDVDAIYFVGAEALIGLLQRPDVVEAARRLALGLMRKGRGMMAKYHDESLADDVFALLAELERG